MRKIVLTFGLIAGAVMSALMVIAMVFQDAIGFDRRAFKVGRSAEPQANREQRIANGALRPLVLLHHRHLQRALTVEIQRADVERERRLYPLVDRL